MKKSSTLILEVVPLSIRIIRKLSTDCLDGSVTIHHLRILVMVEEGNTQKNISDILQVSEAAVSKTMHALVERKLLKKTPGKDKRSHNVSLTPQGKRILKQVQFQVEDKLDKALGLLTKKQQTELALGLNALSELMNSIKGE